MLSMIRTPQVTSCQGHAHVSKNQEPAPQPPAQEPPAQPTPQEESFSWNPQDRRVMVATEKSIPNVLNRNGALSVEKAELNGSLEPLNGNYVYPQGDSRQTTAVIFSGAANAINMFKEAYGDWNWSFGGDKLGINPDKGEMFNAYYSRWDGTVNFFHAPDPIVGQNVHSGHSGEIVTHEVGHAILDGIRPSYLGTWSLDPGAFHESFGDMLAILSSLQDERVLGRLAVQTGGDLSKPNVAALMAEELGQGINNSRGANSTGGDFIRNANNSFKWADPSTLPPNGGPDHLGAQVHSFSRLWTGAFWDVTKSIVNENMAAGQSPKDAMRNAGSEMLRSLGNMMKEAPHGDFQFRDMANAWIRSENTHNEGKRSGLIETVMKDRLILPTETTPPPAEGQEPPAIFGQDGPTVRDVTVTLSGEGFGQFEGAELQVPVSLEKALFKSDQVEAKTRSDVKNLIRTGQIRWNDPNYQMKMPQDAFNPQGEPYIGAVVWENGQMKLERLQVTT